MPNKNNVSKKIKIVVKTKKNRRSRSKQRVKRRIVTRIPKSLGSGLDVAYMRCLSDPFTNPPVRAGFGTLIGTSIHTAYLRGTVTTSGTNGCFNMFVLPNQNNILLTSNGDNVIIPSATGAALSKANNTDELNKIMNDSRTLAMGIRLYPMIAATAPPGIIAMGCAPRSDLDDVVAPTQTTSTSTTTGLFNQSNATVQGMPYLREHLARPGGADFLQCTWRPTDNMDFEFTEANNASISYVNNASYAPFYDSGINVVGQSEGLNTQGSFLVVAGTGLPAGASIYYEIILHLETTDSTKSISTCTEAPNAPSVADSSTFPSMESLYRSISNLLPNVDTVVGATTSIMSSPMVRHAASKYLERQYGVENNGFSRISL